MKNINRLVLFTIIAIHLTSFEIRATHTFTGKYDDLTGLIGDTKIENATVNGAVKVIGDTNIKKSTINKSITVVGDTKLMDVKADSLKITGDTDATDIAIKKDITITGIATFKNMTAETLAVTGTLRADGGLLEKMTIQGKTDLQRITVKSKTNVTGKLKAQNSTLKTIKTTGKTIELINTIIESISVRKNTGSSFISKIGKNKTNNSCIIANNICSSGFITCGSVTFCGDNFFSNFSGKKQKQAEQAPIKQIVTLSGSKTSVDKIHFESGKGKVKIYGTITKTPEVSGGKIKIFESNNK